MYVVGRILEFYLERACANYNLLSKYIALVCSQSEGRTKNLEKKDIKDYWRGNKKKGQSREKKTKKNTCIGHHYTQANTDNLNKIWVLQQRIQDKVVDL